MKPIRKITAIYQAFSFRKKLMLSLLIISCFIAAYMGFTSFRLSSGIIYNMGRQLSENNINVINTQLNNYFQSIQDTLTQIIRLPLIQDNLKKDKIDSAEQKLLAIHLSNSIRGTLFPGSTNKNISFNVISIYFKNGYSYTGIPNNQLPYDNYASCYNYYSKNGYVSDEVYTPNTWCENISLHNNLGQQSNYLVGVRLLYDSVTLKKSGIIVYAINETELYKLYSSFSPKAFILHKNGKLLSGADKILLGKEFEDKPLREKILQTAAATASINYSENNKVHLLSFTRIASNDMYFVVPFDYYNGLRMNEIKNFAVSSIVIAIAGMTLAALFALLLSKSLSSSLFSLKNVVQKVFDGNLKARFASKNNDEVSYVGEKFNAVMDQINTLFKTQERDSQIKRNLELRLMQSQINPHLLYNTLDSVNWALKNENTSKANELIMSLSSFFKITLSDGSVLIPLASELDMISNYVNIQKLARGKNITLDIQIPEELKPYKVVKLTLQPMVENAIIHGFSGYRDDGLVTIGANVMDSTIEIWVKDNGIGILPDELLEYNKMLNTYPPLPEQKHFGLYNVNRRIKNIFGDEYGIYIDSEVGNFTKIITAIPYTTVEKE